MIHHVTFKTSPTAPAKTLVWLTDLHLDALDREQQQQFFNLIRDQHHDAILIGGDISNGSSSLMHLRKLVSLSEKPVYFVLGNHDYYHESIAKMRSLAEEIGVEFPHVHYLTTAGIIPWNSSVGIIGHDGWADGRAGDFLRSPVMLNDYFLIQELTGLTPDERLKKLNELGSEAAEYLREKLVRAFLRYERVILLTHAPPFREACLYEGRVCDDNWAPHFVCQILGDDLLEIAKKYPDHQLLVLSGHSHSRADIQVLPNLRVLVGHSELGLPAIQGILHVN